MIPTRALGWMLLALIVIEIGLIAALVISDARVPHMPVTTHHRH